MTVNEVLENLKINTLPNITRHKQTSDDFLINVINEGLYTIHSMFNIRTEQAIILVPAFRNTFILDNSDPNVIMASFYKIAECSVKAKYKSKAELIQAALQIDKNLQQDILLSNNKQSTDVFKTKHDEVLKILDVEDDRKHNYVINEHLVFAIDQKTLYFPHCKESEIIYVKYKPKPIKASISAMDAEIDLPDTLVNVLYAFVHLKIDTGLASTEGMRNFYPNILAAYNQEIEKAMHTGAVVPNSLHFKNLKGFV